MRKGFQFIGLFLVFFITILIVNTVRIGSTSVEIQKAELKQVNIQKAVDRLSKGLKIPTISKMNSDNIESVSYTHLTLPTILLV